MKTLIAAIAGLIVAGIASAAEGAPMRAILNLENDSHATLVVMQNGSIDGPVLSFSCTPGKDTFGVSLHLPDHTSWPVDGEKIVVKAGGDTLVDQLFAADGKYLIWGGGHARETFKKVLAHDTITVSAVGSDLPFTFADIGPQIGRWRDVCGMK